MGRRLLVIALLRHRLARLRRLLRIGGRRRHQRISGWLLWLCRPLHCLSSHLGCSIQNLLEFSAIQPHASAGRTVVNFYAVPLNNNEGGDSVNGTGSHFVHFWFRPSALIQVLLAS